MKIPQVRELTKDLIRFKTLAVNGEYHCAHYLGEILNQAGFSVNFYEFADKRTSLVAKYPSRKNGLPIVFTGHIDVVPLGANPWKNNPFQGETDGDKLYGRGSTDMKGGVAAMVIAAITMSQRPLETGITVVITAGEETGCQGAANLTQQPGALGEAGAVIVGEPTNNLPMLGHRGVLWLDIISKGVTAHGSMPQEGVNAIYKAARAISKLKGFKFPHSPKSHVGPPTLNVSTIEGGININSVPDSVRFSVDLRTVDHEKDDLLVNELHGLLGKDVFEITKGLELDAVSTSKEHPFVETVFELCKKTHGISDIPIEFAPFFTDASYLQGAYPNACVIILGPGITEMAHKTDEYVLQSYLDQAVPLYCDVISSYQKYAPQT